MKGIGNILTPNDLPRIAFGPFEVDAASGELLNRGLRVRLPGQAFEILLFLLKTPNEVVSRERLREQIWKLGTFVDFEHGLNSSMNKLRRALGDSADKPRYIETVPGRGYRFIGNLERLASVPVSAGSDAQSQPAKRVSDLRWKLAVAAVCLIAVILGLRSHYVSAALPAWKLTRITPETVHTDSPAISADGKLVAYSSDAGLSGEQDLYVKQIAGGQPIRLTFDGAQNTTPDFSPDGSEIVFRSSRGSGGIYEVPTLGGEIRAVASGGLNPKFSPDGSQVAYWNGSESVSPAVPGSGTVWVVAGAGGQPKQVGLELTAARLPIWSRDGKSLLMIGYTSARTFDKNSLDWWLVPTTGGPPVRTGALEALIRGGLQAVTRGQLPMLPAPGCWSATGDSIVFSFPSGDAWNLWQIPISQGTGKVSGVPDRLTTGSGHEQEPSCAASGSIAFANYEISEQVWFLPFDSDRALKKGRIDRAMDGPVKREAPSFSRDGRHIAFSSDQSGRFNIYMRDLETGAEATVASSPFVQRYPVISPAGDKVAFSVFEKDGRAVYEGSAGRTPSKLCEGCLRATDWSVDEKRVLIFGGNPYQINILDTGTGGQTALLTHSGEGVLYGRFSPDQRWVSFTARTERGHGRIAIASMAGPKPISESAWITIAEGASDDYADWSPDGRTLYFTSDRDGNSCLWGQRIDMKSGHPLGDAFAVQHFHGRLTFVHGGWSVTRDRFALALKEATGNIWTMSRSGRP